MTFKPGQSGNPSGRPKAAFDVQALARTHTPAAIKTLVEIMGNAELAAASRVSAAVALIERGYGKPIQPTTNETTVTVKDERDELKRAIVALFAPRHLGSGNGVVH